MKNVVAFFDIDGTIFRNSLMIEHFKKLIKYEVIDPALWYGQIKDVYKVWYSRFGEYEEYLELLAKVYLDELKGVNKMQIDFIASQVINVEGDMVYKYSRDQIQWHLNQGHKVIFISGSPDFLVEKMAEKYNATDFRGTEYIVNENNEFTGELIRMWDSVSKQEALDELIAKYDVDLTNSYAYGDTTGDFSMLKMVGHPVAINPNKPLLLEIKADDYLGQRAKIIIERKDVIYELDSKVNIL